MGKEKKKLIVSTQQRLNMWTTKMLRLASSSIQWGGLPDTIDPVYLEYCLVRQGSAIIVNEPEIGLLCGSNASTGNLDIYGYPMNRSVIFRNGQQAFYGIEDSVIIYNNSMRCGDYPFYQIFANDLANIDMAVRVNINSQKTMSIIPSSLEQSLSLKNLYQDIEENRGMRIVDESAIDIEKFKAALQFDNRQSFTADNMILVQRELWNRCLTFIGINNVNVEKRERVNTFETNSNLDEIYIMRRDRLNSRDRACKLLKMQFGIDVSVKYYSDNVSRETLQGGGVGGEIYSGSQDDTGTMLA